VELNSLVVNDLVYEAKAKTFFSRPRTWRIFKAKARPT